MKYTLDEIKEAYRKLKNYIYYEDNEVDLKIKIAEFEMREKFEKELEIIVNEVNNYSTEEDKNYINSLIKKIGYKVYPKKIENDDIENSKEGIITNKTTHLNKIKIEEVKYIIDMPIELHIISVLWIMKLGVLIDVEISENTYGNRLSKNIEKKQTTFKPYFKKYKEWRNKAIEKAEELLNNNINISLISLDIKNFYHSINFKRSIIENNINIIESIEHSNLIDVIENICIFYTGLFKEKSKTYILPIGLLPSMILSNLYLKEFDNLLIENIECEYYGRYVDDILILFKEENNIKYSNITDFINKKLLKTGILNIKNGEEKIFEITSNPELLIQSGKSKLYLFDYNNSKSLIKKMMKELVIESSEYRFLPDEKHFNSDFESESYDINYSGSVNKLRNIVEVKPNKYAISKYLAKEIYFSKLYKKNKEETFIEETETLLNFFRGKILIEYFDLWNKVVTFFMINDLKNEINIFVEYIIIAINELETDAKNDIEKNKLKMTLMNYIKHSVYCKIEIHNIAKSFTQFCKENTINI